MTSRAFSPALKRVPPCRVPFAMQWTSLVAPLVMINHARRVVLTISAITLRVAPSRVRLAWLARPFHLGSFQRPSESLRSLDHIEQCREFSFFRAASARMPRSAGMQSVVTVEASMSGGLDRRHPGRPCGAQNVVPRVVARTLGGQNSTLRPRARIHRQSLVRPRAPHLLTKLRTSCPCRRLGRGVNQQSLWIAPSCLHRWNNSC
jgi:hypothetical protein